MLLKQPGNMTENKKTVLKYMEGYSSHDHQKILSCLMNEVTWEIPGIFYLSGKEAFDKKIENEDVAGRPLVTVTRMMEENNIVVAEGSLQSRRKDGGLLNAVFCDVFHLENGKIKQLVSYMMDKSVV